MKVLVSISEASSGKPVTGCTASQFKITNIHPVDELFDFTLSFTERNLDPSDAMLSGIYDLLIKGKSVFFPPNKQNKGSLDDIIFGFGLQIDIRVGISETNNGQTIVAFRLPLYEFILP